MTSPLSRRDFLKLGGLALGALAAAPFSLPKNGPLATIPFPLPQDDYEYPNGSIGRAAHPVSISIYEKPNDQSKIIAQLPLDEIVNLYYELTPSTGPEWNPRWYRVWRGYIHSARVQQVKVRFNAPLDKIPETGQLCEVTVPYTLVYKYSIYNGWQPYYRLYYQTTHWAIGVDAGPDGGAWYKILDELTKEEYFAPAIHLRPIPDEELSPLSPDVPWEEKRIVISLFNQTLTAYEGDQVVLLTKVATGIPSAVITNGVPTNTPAGKFNVQSKMPSKHMGVDTLTAAPDAYNLPGVPWTSFFLSPPGYAFHGTYWHDNFGNQMSHGCVNMRTEEALWLFRWTDPKFELPIKSRRDWEQRGYGTQITIE